MEITVDGEEFFVLRSNADYYRGQVSRYGAAVALVAATAAELSTPAADHEALTLMLQSVRRRDLCPAGGHWLVGRTPIDYPLWADYLNPEIAAQAQAKRVEIDGHVAVWVLVDPAEVTFTG
jgi:hypothetical protein